MDEPAKSEGQEQIYEVVWPLGRPESQVIKAPPPVADLSGKTVGELWDQVFKGDVIFPIIRERLRDRFPGVKFVEYAAFGNTHGADEDAVLALLPDAVREHGCDVVISGIGA